MLAIDGSYTATTAVAGCVHVVVSRGSSAVEVNIFQGFLPGFSNCKEVDVVVSDEFIEYWSFFIE